MSNPCEVHGLYDDLFIFLPSVLCEGKALGTSKMLDLMLTKELSMDQYADPKLFSKLRKIGADVGRKVLRKQQDRVNADLVAVFDRYESGQIDAKGMKTEAQTLMRDVWDRVYAAGVRAAGIPGTGKEGDGSITVDLQDPQDKAWLKTAIAHEMGFLNKFIKAVEEGSYKMPIPRRVKMYADSLSSFYDNARVIGLPNTVLIYWAGPNDKKTCASCQYLYKHGPYTKYTLPTVPRSGATICVTNCRDRLMIKQADWKTVQQVAQEQKSQAVHISALRKIKAEARGKKKK